MTRLRTPHLLAATALGAGLALTLPLSAYAGDDGPTVTTSGATTTIKVLETETLDKFQPKGEAVQDFPDEEDFEPKVGDAFVFASDLTQGSTKVGTDEGKCTATHVDLKAQVITNSCKVTITFANGTLVAADTLTFGGEEGDGGGFDVDLVSGTGAYQGAKGNVHVIEHDCSDDCELSVSDLVITFTTDGSQVTAVPAGGAATGGGIGSNTDDTALLIGLGGLLALVGFGTVAGGRTLAARRD